MLVESPSSEVGFHELLSYIAQHCFNGDCERKIIHAIRTAGYWFKEETTSEMAFCLPVMFIRNTREGSVKVAHFYARVCREDYTVIEDTDPYLRIELILNQNDNTFMGVNLIQMLVGDPTKNCGFDLLQQTPAKSESDCSLTRL